MSALIDVVGGVPGGDKADIAPTSAGGNVKLPLCAKIVSLLFLFA